MENIAFIKNLVRPAIAAKLLLTSLICVLTANGVVAGSNASHRPLFHASILVKIAQSNKTHKVRLYPNVTNEVLFFTADGQEGKVYQLYVFDMDGKLAKQTQVRNKETTLLAKFDKGNYLFEVFSNDDRIENGSIIVR